MDEGIGCLHCGHESDLAEYQAEGGHCPVCGKYNEELDMGRHYASRHTAFGQDYADAQRALYRWKTGPHREPPDWEGYGKYDFYHDTGQLPIDTINEATGIDPEVIRMRRTDLNKMVDHGDQWTPWENNDPPLPGPRDYWDPEVYKRMRQEYRDGGGTNQRVRSSYRMAAIEFLAAQNTDDRQELLFRAHRHASEKTARLPVPVAQRTVQAFVAAVNREVRPPRREPVQRTAAVVPDFDDQLLFDS